jgi:hypothetical protein
MGAEAVKANSGSRLETAIGPMAGFAGVCF